MVIGGIELTGVGGDVFFVALVVAFFVACVGLVRVCTAIMGPDPVEMKDGTPTANPLTEPVAVGASR